NMKPIVVPENHYFVLGDYRTASADSRIIGCVPFDKVKGKVFNSEK
ncbi:MAG: signal peptidase I, partial [Alistipes sp.]|nr:signal peptidase I [Alistipes sp.]